MIDPLPVRAILVTCYRLLYIQSISVSPVCPDGDHLQPDAKAVGISLSLPLTAERAAHPGCNEIEIIPGGFNWCV
jgi:hypothetical protein